MERSLSSRSQSINKKRKKQQQQQQPVKVVYISNPVRLTTSAADFRAIVQKLTGRDSDAAAESSAATSDSSGSSSSSTSEMSSGGALEACDNKNSLVAPAEVFDDEQMLEKLFCGFMPPSSLYNYYEPLQLLSCSETTSQV